MPIINILCKEAWNSICHFITSYRNIENHNWIANKLLSYTLIFSSLLCCFFNTKHNNNNVYRTFTWHINSFKVVNMFYIIIKLFTTFLYCNKKSSSEPFFNSWNIKVYGKCTFWLVCDSQASWLSFNFYLFSW